jgi:hypothetical protein
MTARAYAQSSNQLAIVFQVVGALALLVVAIVVGLFFVKFATLVVTHVLPIAVVAMVLYVLLRLMVDAGQETAE